MDYTAFLQSGAQECVLPYFEGKTVCDSARTYRLRQGLDPGWHRFRIEGRYAESQGLTTAEPESWSLPSVSGYVVSGRLVTQARTERLFDLPTDEGLPRFVPILAWRWFDGRYFYAHQDFETDVELAVRFAYEDEQSIAEIKGVTPELAQAFVLETTQRTLLRERDERRRQVAELRDRRKALQLAQASLRDRIALALSHSGADLMDYRAAGGAEVVVRYRLDRQRYECVVDTDSLRIVDAGICLEGTDRELSLSSLPSAVREASQTGELYVFRRG